MTDIEIASDLLPDGWVTYSEAKELVGFNRIAVLSMEGLIDMEERCGVPCVRKTSGESSPDDL